MRTARRRHRTADPLASPEAVRRVCQQLRERLSDLIPKSEQELMRFLYAVRHVERCSATETRRGRPSRWLRGDLIKAASVLRNILERETQGRLSLSSFIGQYLQVLLFPADVTDALAEGGINLQEAGQLSRLTAERLDCSLAKAKNIRIEVLHTHVTVQGSQNGLRARVKEMLGEVPTVSSESMTAIVQKIDELLEIDPSDKRHIFYEEMKRLFYAMREVEPEDVDDTMLERFMKASDDLSNVIYAIELRRRQRIRMSQKFSV